MVACGLGATPSVPLDDAQAVLLVAQADDVLDLLEHLLADVVARGEPRNAALHDRLLLLVNVHRDLAGLEVHVDLAEIVQVNVLGEKEPRHAVDELVADADVLGVGKAEK
jgi:hypothetical protein